MINVIYCFLIFKSNRKTGGSKEQIAPSRLAPTEYNSDLLSNKKLNPCENSLLQSYNVLRHSY